MPSLDTTKSRYSVYSEIRRVRSSIRVIDPRFFNPRRFVYCKIRHFSSRFLAGPNQHVSLGHSIEGPGLLSACVICRVDNS